MKLRKKNPSEWSQFTGTSLPVWDLPGSKELPPVCLFTVKSTVNTSNQGKWGLHWVMKGLCTVTCGVCTGSTHFKRNFTIRSKSKFYKVFVLLSQKKKKVRKNMNITKTEDKTKDGVAKESNNEVSRNKSRVASDLEIVKGNKNKIT